MLAMLVNTCTQVRNSEEFTNCIYIFHTGYKIEKVRGDTGLETLKGHKDRAM